MFKYFVISFMGLVTGISLTFMGITYFPDILGSSSKQIISSIQLTPAKNTITNTQKEVIGFLPYWFLDKARIDYSGSITTLDYFSLTPDTDGTILKYSKPIESEPGWYALNAGKLDPFFENAKKNKIKLSLTIFQGDQDKIINLLANPVAHADNLMQDIGPVMKKYGFSDLNLDIERITLSSSQERNNFTLFVKEIRKQMDNQNLGSISIDEEYWNNINGNYLIDTAALSNYVDKFILMGYDYHSTASNVTGPVAPLYGVGTIAEFDIQTAVNELLSVLPPSKVILAIPFYGYSWETIDNFERAAVIPTTAVIKSNQNVESLISTCANCTPIWDADAKEHYIIYKNEESGTYQQIFYPDAASTKAKIDFVNGNNLAGLAIWALGYEDMSQTTSSILNPIRNYISH